MLNQKTKAQKAFNIFNIAALTLGCIIFVVPYIIVISSSFSDEIALISNGYSLIPKKFSLYAYKFLFRKNLPIVQSIGNTLFVVIISTILTTLTCTLYGYALQHPALKLRKFFNLFIVFTMLFSGGLIPTYLVVTRFFEDSLWSLIIPSMMAAYYVFLLRNYFLSLPVSLAEAAELDGAGHFTVLFRIYMPLSVPVIVTVAMYMVVLQWNNYVGPMLYIESVDKYPLQLTLQKLLDNVENMVSAGNNEIIPTESLKMAAIVISTVPVLCVYPLVQRFFINGMMIGGVKE
jgi:putative aldouronate transport system permease protein